MQVAPSEIEEGNIEYKRYFFNLSDSKINHLSAQMNWRINEGNGICHYYLGICDDGTIYTNFSQENIDYSLDMLKIMVNNCNSYIDNIKINRIYNLLWLDVTIKKNYQYINEYRILYINHISNNLSNIIPNYKKGKDLFYNSIIFNNEKYLFFEKDNITKNYITKIKKLIDFNLIITEPINNNINNIDELMNYVNDNMTGNIINNINHNNNLEFNIIKKTNIPFVGEILFGFLKNGSIEVGMKINNHVILSIHNNMIDCNKIYAPATISIRLN